MKVTERLYKSVEEIWQSYNSHPFVSGIACGTLDKEKFKFYMIQDYLYLMDYAKVFAIGVLKSKTEDHMRMFADLVHSILNGETKTHKVYMERLGISKEDIAVAKASLVTESYTKYMLAVGMNEGIAEVATAVLACSWSYKCIGDYIETVEGSKEHEFYGQWAKAYTSDDYRKANDAIIELVDILTTDYTEEQIINLETIIINCSRYEYMFWDMAWNREM